MIAEGSRYHKSMKHTEMNSTSDGNDSAGINRSQNTSGGGHSQNSALAVDDEETPTDDDGVCMN